MDMFKRGDRVEVNGERGYVNKAYPYGKAKSLYEVAFDHGGLKQVTAGTMTLLERVEQEDAQPSATDCFLFEEDERKESVGFNGLTDS